MLARTVCSGNSHVQEGLWLPKLDPERSNVEIDCRTRCGCNESWYPLPATPGRPNTDGQFRPAARGVYAEPEHSPDKESTRTGRYRSIDRGIGCETLRRDILRQLVSVERRMASGTMSGPMQAPPASHWSGWRLRSALKASHQTAPLARSKAPSLSSAGRVRGHGTFFHACPPILEQVVWIASMRCADVESILASSHGH
jgi:hypothetical protein